MPSWKLSSHCWGARIGDNVAGPCRRGLHAGTEIRVGRYEAVFDSQLDVAVIGQVEREERLTGIADRPCLPLPDLVLLRVGGHRRCDNPRAIHMRAARMSELNVVKIWVVCARACPLRMLRCTRCVKACASGWSVPSASLSRSRATRTSIGGNTTCRTQKWVRVARCVVPHRAGCGCVPVFADLRLVY